MKRVQNGLKSNVNSIDLIVDYYEYTTYNSPLFFSNILKGFYPLIGEIKKYA